MIFSDSIPFSTFSIVSTAQANAQLMRQVPCTSKSQLCSQHTNGNPVMNRAVPYVLFGKYEGHSPEVHRLPCLLRQPAAPASTRNLTGPNRKSHSPEFSQTLRFAIMESYKIDNGYLNQPGQYGLVQISAELVRISAESVQINAEFVQMNAELVQISADQ